MGKVYLCGTLQYIDKFLSYDEFFNKKNLHEKKILMRDFFLFLRNRFLKEKKNPHGRQVEKGSRRL